MISVRQNLTINSNSNAVVDLTDEEDPKQKTPTRNAVYVQNQPPALVALQNQANKGGKVSVLLNAQQKAMIQSQQQIRVAQNSGNQFGECDGKSKIIRLKA